MKNKLKIADFIIIFLAGVALTSATLVLARRAGIDVAGGSTAALFLNLWTQDLYFLALIALFVRFRKEHWQTLGLAPAQGNKPYQMAFMWGAILYFVMNAAVLLMDSLWPGGLQPQNVQVYLNRDDILAHKLFVIATMGAFAPFVEEVLFRGYLFRALINHLHPWAAMVITSLVFGLVHGDIHRAIPLALGGLALNIIAWRRNSIYASTVAHGTWNTIMMCIYYFA